MEWRLKQRRFRVVPVDSWQQSETYHLVSALNLLDRHYNPSLLLAQLHTITLRSKSLLLLAVVLPLHQYVEFHPTRRTNRPGTTCKIPLEVPARSSFAIFLQVGQHKLFLFVNLHYLLLDGVFRMKILN